jgi:hypothetical protein
VTLVRGGAGRPTWTTALPAGATNARVAAAGEAAPNAVTFDGGRVQFLGPITPGARQVAYAYELPSGALPLSLRVEHAAEVLELLVEESGAAVSGARLAEVAPVTTSGRTFRRFLAQNVPPNSVVTVDVPFAVGALRGTWLAVIAAVSGASMLAALVVAVRRRGAATVPAPVAASVPSRASEQLLAEIASLDVRFEQLAAPDDTARARYAAERAALKSRLATALAEERRPD